MSGRRRTVLSLLGATALVAASLGLIGAPGAAAKPSSYDQLKPVQKRHVSGLLSSELDSQDSSRQARRPGSEQPAPAGQRITGTGCPNRFGNNAKVNQNCLNVTDADLQGRGQAQNETWAAADPNDPNHVIATYNDYRRGDGTCGASYSLDSGRSWADATTPDGFTRGAFVGAPREYWQASGDTSVAWDTRGNAYLSCQTFNRGSATSPNPDQSSAFYVYRSTGTNGASWNFPGRPVTEHNDTAGAGNFLLDKQLITVDNHVRSPFRDRVYVSWTTFAADGTSYIFEAFSADYGETFGAPVLVSRDSGLCGNTVGMPIPQGRCNTNQDSQPFTAPDGTLYVVFNNFNNTVTGTDNRNQVLLARSTDGGVSFSAPVLVGSFYDLPDCATYQGGADPGRACVPEKGPTFTSIFRAGNYPIGAVNPRDPRQISVSYGSYINRNSQESTGCTPAGFAADGQARYTGVKPGPCNNDIVLSTSGDGGATFIGTGTDVRALPVVTSAPEQARTDQFWQNAAFTDDGRFVVSYYDRGYGQDEVSGFSDITASVADRDGFRNSRVTSSSMPPPTQFEGTFYGDYAGLAVAGRSALPVWSDTRAVDQFLCSGTGTPGNPPRICQGTGTTGVVANDQDAYASQVGIR